jgi:glutamine synthetase type III
MLAALVLATAVLVLASPAAASHPYNNVADFRYGPPAPRHWQAPRNGRGYKAWDYGRRAFLVRRAETHRLYVKDTYFRSWHEAAVPTAPANVRSWGENGLNADMPPRPS